MDVNKRIGDYEILEELGRGGMGRVYRVRNVISDRVEAMKVLLPDLVSRADLESRFLREIKTLAALNHPSIATLRTAMKNGDELVMIMEFVDGQSLSQRLKMGPIPVAEALTYIDQVLDALSYAHAQHVIHRDIKPANMMLSTEGLVKLTDFGIARSRNDVTLTAAGTTTGSLPYMSPEQVNAEPTDARSDLYSVGISLYEMVTGQRPFQADSDFAVMVAHLKEMPRPPIELAPALGPDLNAVIMKAIAKSPADRYQSADDFRHALTSVPAFAATLTAPMAAAVVAAHARAVSDADGDQRADAEDRDSHAPHTGTDPHADGCTRALVPRPRGPPVPPVPQAGDAQAGQCGALHGHWRRGDGVRARLRRRYHFNSRRQRRGNDQRPGDDPARRDDSRAAGTTATTPATAAPTTRRGDAPRACGSCAPRRLLRRRARRATPASSDSAGNDSSRDSGSRRHQPRRPHSRPRRRPLPRATTPPA